MPEPQPPPAEAPRPRSPIVAAVLSLLAPGLGHVYLGQVGAAAALLALDVLAFPVLRLAWHEGGFSLRLLDLGTYLAMLLPRAVAAGWALAKARQLAQKPPEPLPAMIAFAIFVFASLSLASIAKNVVSQRVPAPVVLVADVAGLKGGELVQGSLHGDDARPRVGAPALFLVDASPGAPQRSGALGWVTAVEGGAFFVEGRDAGVPLGNYAGRAVGVLRSPAGGSRVGAAPQR